MGVKEKEQGQGVRRVDGRRESTKEREGEGEGERWVGKRRQ